jgi:hypothetical protein
MMQSLFLIRFLCFKKNKVIESVENKLILMDFFSFDLNEVVERIAIMDILGIATKLNAGKHHSVNNDDVFIDRLNHKYTVTMILVFAAIITTQQYFGSPITCWVRTFVLFRFSFEYLF